MSGSRITNCLLMPHARQHGPMFNIHHDGTLSVDLDRYAIVPIEHYQHLEELVELGAERIAAETLQRICPPATAPRTLWQRLLRLVRAA